MSGVIEASHLTYRYGRTMALDDLSVEVPEGRAKLVPRYSRRNRSSSDARSGVPSSYVVPLTHQVT